MKTPRSFVSPLVSIFFATWVSAAFTYDESLLNHAMTRPPSTTCQGGLRGIPRLPAQLAAALLVAPRGSLHWPKPELMRTRWDYMVLGRFSGFVRREGVDWFTGIVDHQRAGVWDTAGNPVYEFSNPAREPTDTLAVDLHPSGLTFVARVSLQPKQRRMYLTSYPMRAWGPAVATAVFNVNATDLVHLRAIEGQVWTYESDVERLCSRHIWGKHAGKRIGCFHLPNKPRIVDLGSTADGRLRIRNEHLELFLDVNDEGLIPALRIWGDSP